jgi:hypothetical protein
MEVGGRRVPAILSVHPFQRGIDLHPEVIGLKLAEHIRPGALQPGALKAA